MNSAASFRPKTSEIPTLPGVYRFFGVDDRVLYVGKAKNLRARLVNYFASAETLAERTRLMVSSAIRVQWTIVGSEIEALQLEYSWIKAYNPPFNVVFRDDKSYPYIALTLGDEAPRAIVTRNRKIAGAKYFGPFPQVWAVYETLALLQRAIPIRTCKAADYQRAMQSGKPCFASQINKCGGPCSHQITIAEHRDRVNDYLEVLAGNTQAITKKLSAEMHQLADEQKFEEAALLRDRLSSLEQIVSKSAVVLEDSVSADVFGVAADELSIAAELFEVRAGRIISAQSWKASLELDTAAEIALRKLIFDVYSEKNAAPREILVPFLPEDHTELEEWLTELSGNKVEIRIPQRGAKRHLAETVGTNAKEDLIRFKLKRASDYATRSQALIEIQESLGLELAPLRIEAYDVSHLGGTGIVGSMVVFEDGLAKPKDYRSFKVEESTDDTESMYQILMRRLARLRQLASGEIPKTSFEYPPALILVDGGQPQVAAAQRALIESGFEGSIALAGIAKRLEELWLPGNDYPAILSRNSEGLYLLQRLRDEAHRFALRHQKVQRKTTITSALDSLSGVGEDRRKRLLKAFGSIKKIRQATIEEIAAVPGFGPKLATQIVEQLKQDN